MSIFYVSLLMKITPSQSAIAVGWNSTIPMLNWNNIVETGETVKVKWPNVNIGPPSTAMTKKLAKCEWQVSAAKIIARGEWTEMCDKRINLEKYGIANPERDQRKIIQKREETESSLQNSDKTTACKSSTKRAEALLHQASKQDHISRKYKAQKENQPVISDESSTGSDDTQRSSRKKLHSSEISRLQRENKKLKAEVSKLETLIILSNDLTEMKKISLSVLGNLESIKKITAEPVSIKISGEGVDQSAKHDYGDTILEAADAFLLKQNPLDQTQSSKQKGDIERSSAAPQSESTFVSVKMTKQTDQTILRDSRTNKIRPQSASTSSERSLVLKEAESQGTVDTVMSQTADNLFDRHDRKSIHSREPVTLQADTLIYDEEILQEAEVIIHPKFANEIIPQSSSIAEAGSLALQTGSKSIIDGNMIQDAKVDAHASNPLPKSELMELAAQNPTQLAGRQIALGDQGVVCSASGVLQCNHAVPEKLICDLLSVVFSKEELATSSLTGKVSNTHLKKGVLPKLQLDPVRVNAVRCKINKLAKMPLDEIKLPQKSCRGEWGNDGHQAMPVSSNLH